MTTNNEENSVHFLRSNSQFLKLPPRVQELILKSPNAISDFKGFFAREGKVLRDKAEPLGSYRSEPSEQILLNEDIYRFANTREGSYAAERLFSMLAHEIGHDKDRNTAFSPTGSQQEYIQFKSDKEAKAIFNAFPIFADLEKSEPSFKPSWNAVGYDSMGLLWPQIYGLWKSGQISEKDAVQTVAKYIPDFPYTRDDNNGNQFKTWRDYYLYEYEQVNRSKAEHTFLPYSDPRHRDHALHETIRRHLPAGTSDEMAAHITLQAKVGRVKDAQHVDVIMVHENRIFVMSKTPGFRAHVDLSETPPPITETMQRSESLDAERAQQREQWMAQEQQLSQGRSLSRSL